MSITYRRGAPPLDDCLAVYRACALGARRPIDDRERMAAMFAHANLIIGAYDGTLLVGVARAITDTAYSTYLADLAVRESHQRTGVGRGLVQAVRDAAPQATIILLAAPMVAGYYPRIGFTNHDSAWVLKPGRPLA